MGRPVLHRRRWPSLFGWVPCCCATAHSSLLRPSCSLATGGSAVSPAPIRVRLDYLQGQGRLMRPPRDGSLQIHLSQGPSGRAFGTESLVLADYLLPACSPSMSADTGMTAGRTAPAQPEPSLTARLWVRLRPRSAVCRAPIPSDSETSCPAPAIRGQAPIQVRRAWAW